MVVPTKISWIHAPDDGLLELDAIEEELREVDAPVGSCRYCGCSEERACFPGEWWIRPGVCSSCVAVDVLATIKPERRRDP